MGLGTIDFAKQGKMSVSHRPDGQNKWEISRDGYPVTYSFLTLVEIEELRDALNQLHVAIFSDDAPLGYLRPAAPVEVAVASDNIGYVAEGKSEPPGE